MSRHAFADAHRAKFDFHAGTWKAAAFVETARPQGRRRSRSLKIGSLRDAQKSIPIAWRRVKVRCRSTAEPDAGQSLSRRETRGPVSASFSGAMEALPEQKSFTRRAPFPNCAASSVRGVCGDDPSAAHDDAHARTCVDRGGFRHSDFQRGLGREVGMEVRTEIAALVD